MSELPYGLDRPRLLARNAALNAASLILPLLLAVPILPYVLQALGPDRFAVLTLAWTLIGYFGFLDLGLGRATTKFVATALGTGRRSEVRHLVWSSLSIQLAMGLAGAALIAAVAPLIAGDVLRITEPVLLAETRRTFAYVAAGLPLVLLSGTFGGVLEAHQRFDLVNLVRVPTNVAMLVVPTAGVTLGWSVSAIVLGLLAARAGALFTFAALAGRVAGGLRPVRPDGATLSRLIGFGGWIAVSLVAVPILSYAERFLVGGLRSLTELAYYAVAFEIVARTAVIPAAIALTLFPAFSYAQESGGRVAELFRRPLRMLFLLEWPLLVGFWLFAAEILGVWVGAEIAAAAAPALRLLAVAFFLNAFSQIALAGVQGLGRPDLKAKLDLMEVPLFVGLAALLIPRFGITGAAMAKLLVTVLDTTLLFMFAARLGAPPLLDLARVRRGWTVSGGVLLTLLLIAAAVMAPVSLRVLALAVALLVLGGAFWTRALEPTDRAAVRGLFSRILPMKEVTP